MDQVGLGRGGEDGGDDHDDVTDIGGHGDRPDFCHFFSTNVLSGSIFLHMKSRKLWQKFRDKTA